MSTPHHGPLAAAARTLPVALALAGAYLVDAAQGTPSEIVAALASGVLAAGLWAAVRAASPVPGNLPRHWPAALTVRLRAAPVETLLDGAAFVRAAYARLAGSGAGPHGRLIEQPLPRRPGDAGVGDRALATFGTNVSPDSCAAAEDRHRHRLVVHRLVRTGPAGAKPRNGSDGAKPRNGSNEAKPRNGSNGAKPRNGKTRS